MNPFAATVVKTVGAAGVAALLGAGVVSAASPSPSPKSPSSTSATQPAADRHADRRAVRRAIIEAEADVLGLKPDQLVKDLKSGQKISDLARDKGMTKEQFANRLGVNLKPRLAELVDRKVITRAQADKVIDRIAHDYVPFWNGLHHRKK